MSENKDIILAAVAAAGVKDDGFEGRVIENAKAFTAMMSEQSRVNKVIDSVKNAKTFTGIVESIVMEQTSKRGVLTLKTKPSEYHPDGLETVRTERSDSDDSVLPMMRRLRDLKGSRVLVWVEVQNAGTKKVRVLQHFEAIGSPEDEQG